MNRESPESSRQNTEKQAVTLGRLASGQVVVDRFTSHLHESPQMMALLQQAFQNMQLGEENYVRAVVDFNRHIGESTCVKTSPEDIVVFAQREKRPGLTRFVKNREPEPTHSLNIVLMKNPKDPKVYILMTAFLGTASEREPWDPEAPETAKDFWQNHALLWGTEKTVPKTEVSESASYWERMPPPPGAPPQRPPPHELRIQIPAE